jgi:hypothetical protein
MKGMAFENSPRREPQPLADAVELDRLGGVLAARRLEPASRGKQRRDEPLV